MKKYLGIISIFLFSLALYSQNEDVPFDKRLFPDDKVGFTAAIKDIKEGDFHFFDGSRGDLTSALYHYLRAQEFNPYSSMLNYKIGLCYLYSNQKFKSLEHLEFAYRVNPEVDENIRFYLAQGYQLDGNFEKAIELYTEHKDIIKSGDKYQRMYINKKITECRTGIKLKETPLRVWIDNLGDSVNTKYPEFSPVISADNRVLFYTARRPDSQGEKVDKTGYHYEDVYSSTRRFGTDWGMTKNLGSPVNTKSHDATVGLAPDGKSLIIYRGINANNGDLFITREKEDGTWEEPVSLGDKINTKYHESSASLSFDEKTLYFVSDQPGGLGQHDIYVAHWDEETSSWGDVENLGDVINTEYEEKGVFLHEDGKTLYFSSDGHKNMGGLDVFKSVYDSETGVWSEPENLGYPINTPDDDIYFVVTGNGRYAYYSSYREDGLGEKDIYKITFLGPKKTPLVASADMTPLFMDRTQEPAIVSQYDDKGTDVATNNTTTNNNTDNSNNDAELEKLRNEIRKMSGLIDDYKGEISDLKKQVEAANKNTNNTATDNSAEVNELKKQIADLKKQLDDANEANKLNDTEEVTALKNDIADLKKQLDDARNAAANNNTSNTNSNCDSEIAKLKKEIADLKKEVEQANAASSMTDSDQVKTLKTQVADLKKQLEEANNAAANNNSGNDNSDKIKDLNEQISELKAEVERLRNQGDNTDGNNTTNNTTSDRPKIFLLTGKVTECTSGRGITANVSVTNSATNEKVKDIITNSDGTYTVALEPGASYGLTATGTGYGIDSKKIETKKTDFNTDKVIDFSLCRAKPGTKFTLRNIYFDFDKSDLRIESNNELDKLITLMNDRPDMTIELGGHTDRRGDDEYNLVLSRERARVAKEYLVRKGISASRIETKGYGETQPEVSGSEISAMKTRKEKEDAHQQNRRTVVTILSE